MRRHLLRAGEPGQASPVDAAPRKLYYKIGEVCDLTGLTAHVLRYWEKEFPHLAPKKTASGHRLYREKDIQTILLIKNLLYEKKFTIRGAREHISGVAREVREPVFAAESAGEVVGRVQEGLARLRGLLSRKPPL